jgi:ectoine hydroxylase-related dioxygenase (phytanoyl-CoA dioxygenase family)
MFKGVKYRTRETMTSKQLIDDFKQNGISVIENLKENQIVEILKVSNNAYYNTNDISGIA